MLKRCDDENATASKPRRVVGFGGDDRTRASFVEQGAAVPAWTQDIISAVKSATGWGKKVAGLSLQASTEDKVEVLEGMVTTKSAEKARELGRRLNVGTVYHNCNGVVDVQVPWTGRRESGVGGIFSRHFFRENFQRPKSFFFA